MPRPLKPETLIYDLVGNGDPHLSPDGEWVSWTQSQASRQAKLPASQVWIARWDGAEPRRLEVDGDRTSGARWSPDGTHLACVSSREGGASIMLVPAAGGEARELTRHNVAVGDLTWSPDGARILYTALYDPENPDEVERDKALPPRVRVTRRIDYKQDGRGYLEDARIQCWIVDVASGHRRMVTLDPVDHSSPQWSPDGETISARIALLNGMASQLVLVDLASGAVTRVGAEHGTVGVWAWSPDGRWIVMAADDAITWQTDLWLYEVASGALRRLTDDLPCLPDAGFANITPATQPVWLDERHALFPAIHQGASTFWTVDTETGAVTRTTGWQALNAGFSADDARGRFAFTLASLDGPAEIAVWNRAEDETIQVTNSNHDVLSGSPPATWEAFQVERGGERIDGWLLKPPGFDPAKRYPVILDIHGGPNGWYGYGWNTSQQSLAGAGFLVVFSNPRGSGSYGRRFTQLVCQDWAGEDYLDLMAVVDWVTEKPYADADRVGVYGYSYGGYMTSWIVGHTDRFRAAVIGAPVVDLTSFYGTSDIGHIFGPLQMGGRPEEMREEYARRSPITDLHRATTPSLILHGEADDRCPIGQGEQAFVALKEAGCEVEFVRYPGGTHALGRTGFPAHRLDFQERMIEWFRRHLG